MYAFQREMSRLFSLIIFLSREDIFFFSRKSSVISQLYHGHGNARNRAIERVGMRGSRLLASENIHSWYTHFTIPDRRASPNNRLMSFAKRRGSAVSRYKRSAERSTRDVKSASGGAIGDSPSRIPRGRSEGGPARPAIMTISTYTAGTGLFPTW